MEGGLEKVDWRMDVGRTMLGHNRQDSKPVEGETAPYKSRTCQNKTTVKEREEKLCKNGERV